ncbi:MAG: acyl carrier protein [bacterium]|nr:acyl carrier protein [bacterium]
MDEITAEVIRIIGQKVPDDVCAESDFDDLELDSLAMAEVVSELESTFKISADHEILEVKNVYALADYVRERKNGSAD